jgi:hypothetical protein
MGRVGFRRFVDKNIRGCKLVSAMLLEVKSGLLRCGWRAKYNFAGVGRFGLPFEPASCSRLGRRYERRFWSNLSGGFSAG